MIRKYAATAAIVFIVSTSNSFAHGDKHDVEAESAEAVVKEQQAWGIAGDLEDASRKVQVSMSDKMRFSPETLTFSLGETIEFVIKNDGELMHEFVLGTTENNDEHAELMVRFPGMEHDEPYMAHVATGDTGTIVWTFNKAGSFDFACLIAGHYQAGMVGSISVEP